MRRIRAVIFDLDNVLYPEEDYLHCAYRDIARFLSSKCRFSADEIYDRLVAGWREKTAMYPKLFNDLIADIGLEQEIVPELLRIYSCAAASLSLFPGVVELITGLRRRGIRVGLLTNGSVEAQKNKVRLLGVEELFDAVVYARAKGKEFEKPNPDGYLEVLRVLKTSPDEAVYVGDNPYTDFYGAKKLGMLTARLFAGEFKHVKLDEAHEADVDLESLAEVYELVEQRK